MLFDTENLGINRLQIYTFMCEYGRKLRSNRDFETEIIVKHLDESNFHLYNCYWDEDGKRIFIWTEHCGHLYKNKNNHNALSI